MAHQTLIYTNRSVHPDTEGFKMSNHTYKLVEIVGSSSEGTDQAIRNAITKASESLDHIGWFEVMETRGHVEDGEVAHFQVILKVGFRLD